MPSTPISVAEFRKRLGRILRQIENGREIIVTRHGEGIAKLVRVERSEEKLAAIGVRPAERKGPLARIKSSSRRLRRTLTRAILEDRR